MPDFRSAEDEYLRVAFLEGQSQAEEISAHLERMQRLCKWYLAGPNREVKPEFVDEAHGLLSAQQARGRVEAMFHEIVQLQEALAAAVDLAAKIRETERMGLSDSESIFLTSLLGLQSRIETIRELGHLESRKQRQRLRQAVRVTAERFFVRIQHEILRGALAVWSAWAALHRERREEVSKVEAGRQQMEVRVLEKDAEIDRIQQRGVDSRRAFVALLGTGDERTLLAGVVYRWRLAAEAGGKLNRERAAKDFTEERQRLLDEITDWRGRTDALVAVIEEERQRVKEGRAENGSLRGELVRAVSSREVALAELEESKEKVESIRKELDTREAEFDSCQRRLEQFETAAEIKSPVRVIVEQRDLIGNLQRERIGLLRRLQLGSGGRAGWACQMCHRRVVAKTRIQRENLRSTRGIWTSTSTCDSWMETAFLVRMADNVVVVLCGLPASGKSTLAKKIKVGRSEAIHVVDYDAISRRLLGEKDTPKSEFDPEIWRRSRQLALEEMRTILGRAGKSIVIMDDNHFLRSMRKNVCKAAWEAGAGVCCVFVDCPVEVCLRRNFDRSSGRVPSGVITSMFEVMEVPERGNGQAEGQAGWERKIPVVHFKNNDEDSLSEIDHAIDLARKQGIPEFRDCEPEPVTVVEQCETRMRRVVSSMVAKAVGRRKSEIARSLSKVKSEFMSQVKEDPTAAEEIVNEFIRVAGEFS
ncbi:hypothetical protein FOZ63_014337 [Perkinsus olseni]|uniref:Uncharacterized protein n=1 Tax=Perkinsus olseni TaxID=32597 RepID=A0A7J6UHF3_PEROL|nr:hypothetical protein FOZ63_014337 [Perkinsus olseni]KAF4756654.1 hypothetical protein FOZ62_028666 [Perkinsus olseni]